MIILDKGILVIIKNVKPGRVPIGKRYILPSNTHSNLGNQQIDIITVTLITQANMQAEY